jgi:exopolysaccharide production protein ExoQ
MSPPLALFLTLAFIFFLFWRELREKTDVTGALWIPLIWYFICGSRFISLWLDMIGVPVSAQSLGIPLEATLEEGSPIDRIVFFGLLAGGCCVLYKRRIRLSEFARQNVWLTVFLVYCFLAIVWSDFPFIAFKRWLKVLGHPIMTLIIITEPNPQEAVVRILKRTAYLLLPLSILLGKYFPQYGRIYDIWTGHGYYVGVTTDKNALGHICMVLGLFFFWNALQALKMKNRRARRDELFLSVGFFGMTLWLLKLSSSATSLVTMLIGILMTGLLGLRFVNKRLIGTYLLVAVIAFAAADSLFGVYSHVVHSLGRNETLTERTIIWQIVLKLQPNPIFGAGFESFWLGERLRQVAMMYKEKGIAEAHNGYLETYLNLGSVGLVLLVGLLIATFRKIRLDLLRRFEFGRLRLGLFVAIIVYNFTEAAFGSVHFIYTVFFLIAVEYAAVRRPRSQRLSESVRKEAEGAVVSAGAQIDESRIRRSVE